MNVSQISSPSLRNTLVFSLFVFVSNLLFTIPTLAESDDPVVAVVNDIQIYRSQLQPLLNEYKKNVQKTAVSRKEQIEVLKGLIRRQLILNTEDVQQLRNDKAIVQKVNEYEDQLVINKFLYEHVGRHMKASEEELRDYYRKNLHQFSSPPKVKAKHILLRNEEDAKMVLEKLNQGGDFEELARKYSIDLPMALKGGSMGVIQKGKTLPQLEKALFILQVGEYSDIVKTDYGYHILAVDEINTTQYKPYKEVREEIKTIIMRQKEAQAFNEMAADLEHDADITIYDEKLPTSSDS